MPRTKQERPLPPPPAPPTLRCIYDLAPSTGWRWYGVTGEWERICERHATPAVRRRGDYVADTDTTRPRQQAQQEPTPADEAGPGHRPFERLLRDHLPLEGAP